MGVPWRKDGGPAATSARSPEGSHDLEGSRDLEGGCDEDGGHDLENLNQLSCNLGQQRRRPIPSGGLREAAGSRNRRPTTEIRRDQSSVESRGHEDQSVSSSRRTKHPKLRVGSHKASEQSSGRRNGKHHQSCNCAEKNSN
jgi:hypothetical protein